MDTPSFNCRYYEQPFPEVDDVVMVQVKSIAEMGMVNKAETRCMVCVCAAPATQ